MVFYPYVSLLIGIVVEFFLGGISNTYDAELTTGVLRRALAEFGFNTDQGGEFTAIEFTSILEMAGTRISMDGRGRALDNLFVE